MNKTAFGGGLLQGAQMGFGIARMKKQDEIDEQRYQDSINYRSERDRVADDRYQEQIDYQRSRDGIADQRYKDDFGLRKSVHGAQMRNLNHQHEASSYALDRQQQEDARADQLREVQGWISLLQNGDDGGDVAQALNKNPQYQKWLAGRGLSDARFDRLRLNDTGMGEPGAITILKGKDKDTGQVRRGVATVNASSDPEDPVEVMPMPVLAGMIQERANQLESDGDGDTAEQLRVALLKRLQSYQTSLGGQSSPRWGDIEYREDVGNFQRSPDGRVHQLDPGKDSYGASGNYGLRGRRGGGGSGGRSGAFTNQIYKQLSDELPDDPDRQIDNSDLRTLITSMSQGIDLEVGGAFAPGAYVQAGKDASKGLTLSIDEAVSQVQEARKTGLFGSIPDADDPEVQEGAARLLEENRLLFEKRFRENLLGNAGYRGDPEQAQQTKAPVAPAQMSLDDAVQASMANAKAKGIQATEDEVRQALVTKYPDRFGAQVSEAPSDPKKSARYGMSFGQQAEQFDQDVVQPVRHALRGVADKMNQGAKAEKASAQLRSAAKSGSIPPAKTLAEWLPLLGPEDQQLALDLLIEQYPEDPNTLAVLQRYNAVATR